MKLIEIINNNKEIISLISTIVLVIITGIYVWLTKGILGETVKQSKLTYNPVIGIKIKSIGISKVFGKGRRNLNVDLELINVGNAPAIEVQIDSEIIYTHSEIKGEKSIPARFEPSMVSFLRTGDELKEDFKYSPSFGNACITHFTSVPLKLGRY